MMMLSTLMCSLVFSISLGALVACADFLLCVFMLDGTVALCDCLENTKAFGVAKGRVSVSCGRGCWRRSKVTEGWTDMTRYTRTAAMPHRKRPLWVEYSWGARANTLRFDNRGRLLVQ